MPLIRSASLNLFVEILIRIILFSVFCYMESMIPFTRVIPPSELENNCKYPRHESYVPGSMLWSIVLSVPCVLTLIAWAICNDCNDALEFLLAWSLSLGITGVLTNSVKLIVGRPRPDFFYRCFPDGIETPDLQCTGDPGDIVDGRKSFPSGHSSISFCSLGIASLWVCGRLGTVSRRRGSGVRVLCSLVPLVAAACIALSRTCDYHHHWQGDKLKNKWKNLRDAYSKHLRSNKTHTGQAAKLVKRYKTWPWVEQMSFLRPYLEFAITHSNIEGDHEQASTSHQEPSMTDVHSPPLPHQHSRRKKAQQNETQVDKVINFLNTRRNTDFDDIDLVFLGYAKTIKKMTNSRQARVKFQIAKIIMESELEQEEESSLTTVSSTLQGSGNDTVFTNNNYLSQDYEYIVSSPPEQAASFSPQEENEPHNAIILPSTTTVICTQNQQPTYVDPRQYTIQPTKFYYEQFGKKS